ncbi:thioredoxin-like protein [Artomyces pyxidatus]|uniref:Thioredoxin-like protein n=1 Tax=Artomyces pyxidatus TaxID=48021 RepID=A0ACB8TE22_9AGAM|nr:thioredoxin-like protein [Artomyces pyxidatus]
MPVPAVNSLEDFRQIVNSDQLTIFHFWAKSSGPCLAIAPIFEEFSEEARGFLPCYTVDIDEQPDIVKEADIHVLSSFVAYHYGRKIADIADASPRAAFRRLLATLIEQVKAQLTPDELLDDVASSGEHTGAFAKPARRNSY